MGLKEKMMEEMMNKMSPEERKEMMEKLMESFFSKMTGEEKQKMMGEMISRMIPGGGGMMGMMSTIMGGKKASEWGFNPMEMCKKMMNSISQTSEIASFATPEVRGLFEEWAQQIEEEILSFIKEKGSIHPQEIAAHLKISKESVHYFLSRLAQKAKIQLKVEPEKS